MSKTATENNPPKMFHNSGSPWDIEQKRMRTLAGVATHFIEEVKGKFVLYVFQFHSDWNYVGKFDTLEKAKAKVESGWGGGISARPIKISVA